MKRRLIIYNRATEDFAIYLDGDLIGYARSYIEAEAVLDQLRMELLRASHGQRGLGHITGYTYQRNSSLEMNPRSAGSPASYILWL